MNTIVVMGVSGSGKTTVGKLLADRLQLPFYDADDFHPKANLQKMKAGQALNDNDRAPWLNLLSDRISIWNKDKGAVLACSALKEKYRLLLETDNELSWVFLNGNMEEIARRIQKRKDHFFDPGLLQSQFDSLEPPSSSLNVDIKLSPREIVDTILQYLPAHA